MRDVYIMYNVLYVLRLASYDEMFDVYIMYNVLYV